jgi:hypothetical protein
VEAANECRQHQIVLSLHAGLGTISGIERESYRKPSNVYRIDQRVTGDLWEEIQKRLDGIDQRELLSVAQAREVQAEARKIEFPERKQAERDAARPITDTEQKILDAAAAARGDSEKFAAELEQASIGLARVTVSDVQALDALRQDAELGRVTAGSADEQQQRSPILHHVRGA